ncbi:exodeoxyribonuclease V subunit gamma [Ramlibacter henchirensis]|uniref:RecBCD enzyme subunit RecC n=1 Tax=Ramlibacter henchirensis TaxID=204072 RepID=A0A4Z0BT63_9BURK|nr:exodeoxyribonuclease V subunit gamma [Ramlibacter henchirensis]TFZ02487.1 exodeoxyribonuclease V subunit gamma [Ramlibacter henchirensis]
MTRRRSAPPSADSAQAAFDFDAPAAQGWSGGFMVVHGNRPESLRDLMLAWMRGHPLAPLENELVLVQSNGIAQWLKLSLAADPAHGGAGIAAALTTALPARALWDVYRAVLGRDRVPAESPFDKALLSWRLMRLLPALLERPEFEPLRRFLRDDDDLRKRHQLALRLADLLDQYQVYRADWLARWGAGHDVLPRADGRGQPVPDAVRWQPQLWRELLADVGPEGAAGSRAEVHRRFLETVATWQGPPPAGLARRITVFGISTLPRQVLEVLHAASRWSQVLLCVHNPCEHDWSHIVAEQDLHRARRQARRPGLRGEPRDDALHLITHPLLAAWGRQGRDFIRLLDDYDQPAQYSGRFVAIGQRVDLFEAGPQDTLLRQLQDDIRELRPLGETRELWPAVDPAQDASITFHVAHGRQREVEVLHDQLLAAFTADPTLRPRDVIVMVPDVADYAAHVQAVFGLVEPDDDRHIPFGLSDQSQRMREPLLAALDHLLSLPQSRIAAGEVLDLLQVPALRERFGIAEEQLPLLRQWLDAAGVRWGLHADHRESLGLPAGLEQNSWAFGLRRMVLGYAVGAGEAWNGIEPMQEVGGLEAALLGPLVRLAQSLEALWRALREPAPPAVWAARLRSLLDDFFVAPDGSAEGLTLLRARTALDDWEQTCAGAGLHEPLPLSVVREHWMSALEPPALQQPFFAGGVTFASLMPMRAIPFRWVALLGMNDGDYPRSRTPMDFDLMTGDHRPGDRSRREDDRYLFLEALLSAREHLHISWVGRSAQDNQERPPSVLVAQLRDHIAAGWSMSRARDETNAGAQLLAAITVEHRLQPFHPAYFDGGTPRLFSYAREWRSSLEPAVARAGTELLPPLVPTQPLTLKKLGDLLKHPARAFLEQRLNVAFRDDDPVAEDEEPFVIDGLQNWTLQGELIRVQRTAVDRGLPREDAMRAQLERISRRGELPHGAFARQVRDELMEPMERLFEGYARVLAEWPQRLDDEPVAQDEPLPVEDWLDALRSDGSGRRARLVLDYSGIVDKGCWRYERLVPHWVAHLAGHLDGEPLTTIVLSKAGTARFQPLAPAEVQKHWDAVLRAWQEGMRRPLPFDVQVAAAWMRKLERGDEAAAEEAARDCYRTQVEPDAKGNRRGGADALQRAHPDFESLWAGDEFREWVRELLQPVSDAVGTPPTNGGSE